MRLVATATVSLIVSIQAGYGAEDAPDAAGKAIYYSATRLDGSPVTATVQQDVRLPAGGGACVTCHRRSGLGLAEGGQRALNITGPSLFHASDVAPIRPAYDQGTLARALIRGIGASGEPLSDLMPRYQMTGEDVVALARYLRSLGEEDDPGITGDEILLASVITPDASTAEREALELVIPRYLAAKNAGTRQEQRRAVASERHTYGLKRYRAYRHWKHEFWQLEGRPGTWGAQLERYYSAAPPFALVSGSLGSHASVVNEFCERHAVPCILPMTDLPPSGDSGFYSLYFSRGVQLEAAVIANYLSRDSQAVSRGPLVIYEDDESGRAAREVVLHHVPADTRRRAVSFGLRPGSVPSVADWERMLSAAPSSTTVLFVSAHQLQNLVSPKLDSRLQRRRIFTIESLTDWSAVPNDAAIIDLVWHAYPYALPRQGRSQFPREDIWLRSRGLDLSDTPSAVKVLFACKALGMALSDIESNFSRDYLLESLEHALDSNLITSLFPRMSLGPDQRFLSQGAYLARLGLVNGKITATSGDWVQP